jgi:glutamate racemase
MKILFDQGTPVPLRAVLPGHDIATAFELGWASLANGELISHAEENGFELLLTTDQNLRYQQNLSKRQIAILVLRTTAWPRIRQHIEAILGAIERAGIGTYEEVPF